MEAKKIEWIQPPSVLADGLLAYAKGIYQETQDRGQLFSEDEFAEKLSGDFSGKIRFHFLLWVVDLNKVIDGINIVLSDMNDMIADRNSFKGNPVIRTEFLMIAFFGEFFRLREISKIYLKNFFKAGLLVDPTKKFLVDSYYEIFKQFYEVRNQIVHQGICFAENDINVDWSIFKDLPDEVKEKFIALLRQANTKENTVEIQCAIYIKVIKNIMDVYGKFQDKINEVLADMVIAYEEQIVKP